ncbi:MAG TPA: 30S ribosomal protein S17 [Bdellovibrionota bacterium]|nr:30S ribosomal protein S17 [Bdellovibrionota bacterium]
MSAQRVKKVLTGIVIADKTHQTIKVKIRRREKHPFYGKYMVRVTELAVHDKKNEAHMGDLVNIVESRPISRTKRWQLKKIVERSRVKHDSL